MEQCVLCAKRRKQALKSFSSCLPSLLPGKTPQVHRGSDLTFDLCLQPPRLSKIWNFYSFWEHSIALYLCEICIHSTCFSSVAKNQAISASYQTRGLEQQGKGVHMQRFRATKPRLLFDHSHPPRRSSSHQFLTHVNGPLQYLMFLYGVLTIECRNGMRIWLLGRVRIHLLNRAMHSDVEWEGVMKARANSAAKNLRCFTHAEPRRWKPDWTICSSLQRHFAEAIQATVVCGES